jgi:hypothetical protein
MFRYRGRYRSAAVPTCRISVSDLRKLFLELDSKAAEALELHLSGIRATPHEDHQKIEDLKQDARTKVRLTVTLQGVNGEQIMSESVDALSDENIPDELSWVSFDSSVSMQSYYNVTPVNRFTVRLDFSEPPGFDSYNPWDQPTPNNSYVEVSGDNDTWATAVFESTLSFFKKKARPLAWLHRQQFYNLLHWLVGLPAALWVTYRVDVFFGDLSANVVLKGGVYVYIFLVSLLFFRLAVWALRWMFPVVELEGARSSKARTAVGTLLIAVAAALLSDVVLNVFF